jgi:hypothetical protein
MSETGHVSTTGRTSQGFGRLLVALYGILAFAALGRSSYQVATTFPHTPVAYWLSALAALIYVVVAVAVAKGHGRWRSLAWGTLGIEAVGVLTVGFVSLASAELRHDGTVWRSFGADYGYLPLILPFVGLWWLARTRRPASAAAQPPAQPPAPPSESES